MHELEVSFLLAVSFHVMAFTVHVYCVTHVRTSALCIQFPHDRGQKAVLQLIVQLLLGQPCAFAPLVDVQ